MGVWAEQDVASCQGSMDTALQDSIVYTTNCTYRVGDWLAGRGPAGSLCSRVMEKEGMVRCSSVVEAVGGAGVAGHNGATLRASRRSIEERYAR